MKRYHAQLQGFDFVLLATGAMSLLAACDAFAEPISLIATQGRGAELQHRHHLIRMLLLGMAAVQLLVVHCRMRDAAYATISGATSLGLLATLSLLIAPASPLPPFGDLSGSEPPLLWGPAVVIGVHAAIVASLSCCLRYRGFHWANHAVYLCGLVLAGVVWFACTPMVSGGWLLLTISESPLQFTTRVCIYVSLGLAITLRNAGVSRVFPLVGSLRN